MSLYQDDIFLAWSKLRETSQLLAGMPVSAPPRHRKESKLAEELVKEISGVEKNNTVSLVIPATELGLVRGLLDSNISCERPIATRLESLEDMMKSVVDKLTKMEGDLTTMASTHSC